MLFPKKRTIKLNLKISFIICCGLLAQTWPTFVIIRGKHTVNVKHAIHSQSNSHLKTGIKMKFTYQEDYLHRNESQHHIYSVPDLKIRLENINEMFIISTVQKGCRGPWSRSSLLWASGFFSLTMSHVRHTVLLCTPYRTDHQHLMAQGCWNVAFLIFFNYLQDLIMQGPSEITILLKHWI